MQIFYVQNGVAVEKVTLPTGVPLSECRHPDYALHCIEAPDNVRVGWIYNGMSFSAPIDAVLTSAELISYAAMKRYNKEIGGITAGGVRVATDERSKQMIMGARIAAEADPGFTTPWVGSDGIIATLTATQVVGLSNAVLAHVRECFSIFADVVEKIGNGAITALAEIDAAFA